MTRGLFRCEEHGGVDRVRCPDRLIRRNAVGWPVTPLSAGGPLRTVRAASRGCPAGDRRSRCFSRLLAPSLPVVRIGSDRAPPDSFGVPMVQRRTAPVVPAALAIACGVG